MTCGSFDTCVVRSRRDVSETPKVKLGVGKCNFSGVESGEGKYKRGSWRLDAPGVLDTTLVSKCGFSVWRTG